MSQKDMAYDHPAYLAVQAAPLSVAAGSGATSRFVAHADLIARALHLKPATAGTSADTVTAYAVTGTITKTLGVTTITSGQTAAARLELTTASRTLTLGDEIRMVKGTDATLVLAATLEYNLKPGATVTE